jgi:hypothetical protein
MSKGMVRVLLCESVDVNVSKSRSTIKLSN